MLQAEDIYVIIWCFVQFCDKTLNIVKKLNNGFHLGTSILWMVQGNRKEKLVDRISS